MISFIRICLTAAFIIVFGKSESLTDSSLSLTADIEIDVEAQAWVDSVYQQMTIDERIGQLMMIRAYSNQGEEHETHINKLIDTYHIGALCFFQGTPEKQLALTNSYQQRSKIPLLIAIDAEWGLGMRHKEAAISFPRQLALGAIEDDNLIYEMGREIGKQLRRIGVHINFAPVVDVNNNKDNPVINSRSFGEQHKSVAEKGVLYMLGMQNQGVLACAKHFPGHGDTDVDSHYDLPVITHDMNRLDSIELRPFHRLIAKGVNSIMVAHLQVPALEDRPNTPTTLSYNTVTSLLKERMGFTGIIFTDAMDMKGVTKHHPSGLAEAKAIEAGNDMLCLPSDVGLAVQAIKEFMAEGKISEMRLAESVKKILLEKYHLGLTSFVPISNKGLEADIFNFDAKNIANKLIEKSLTIVRDDQNIFPLKNISPKTAALDICV